MNVAELARRASPFAEMQRRLFEHEQRIRDLIDSPTLRWLRETNMQRHRLSELDRYSERVRQLERVRDITAPGAAVAEFRANEQKRLAELQAWTNPMVELSRKLAELDTVGAVYRRVSETVVDRMAAIQPAWAAAEAFASKMVDVGAIVRELKARTSAALNYLLPLATQDYSGVAAAFKRTFQLFGLRRSLLSLRCLIASFS